MVSPLPGNNYWPVPEEPIVPPDDVPMGVSDVPVEPPVVDPAEPPVDVPIEPSEEVPVDPPGVVPIEPLEVDPV